MPNSSCRILVLALVSSVVLFGCTARTILHGGSSRVQHVNVVSDDRLHVWLVKSTAEGLKLVDVVRPFRRSDKLEQAVSYLLQGPDPREMSSGLGSEIPRGTILIGVARQGNQVQLNLSQRFASGGGTSSFETRLEQLRRTVTPLAGSDDVYLNIEGRRLNVATGEGIEVHQPINR